MHEKLLKNAPRAELSSRACSRLGKVWRGALAVLTLAAAGVGAGAQTPPSVIDVRAGDTFSGIATQFTGNPAAWRKMYRADLSGLHDPNRLQAGMRFEVANDAQGNYLRLVGTTHGVSTSSTQRTVIAPAPPAPTLAAAIPVSPIAPAATAALPWRVPTTRASNAAGDDSLVVGVLPNIPAAILTTQYQSLQRYLVRVTGRKVRVVVPVSFKAFFDSTMAGEFDLAVAAPHFARVAQLDRNLVPLVAYEPPINALFVAPANGGVAGARDVRERAVAFANPQSLVAMYGQQWLSKQNMEPGRDYEAKGARTDLGVGRMLLSADAVAAIMSNGEFRSLPPEESARLKIVEVFARMPNFIVLANPQLPSEQQNSLKLQLKAFLADKADGVAFAQATGVTAIVDVDDNVLRELDAFVVPTRRAMGYGK